MKKRHFILLVIPLAFLWSAAIKKIPSSQQYAESITADDLRKHLSVIASDEYEGRETGERGQKMAAEYISGFFKSIGIPAQQDGTWYQQVKLVKISGGTGAITAWNGDGTLYAPAAADFYYASNTPSVDLSTEEIVFLGYGIDDPKYSDYAAHDSSWYVNKVLIVLDGEPSDSGIFTITGTAKAGMWTTQRRAKYNAAKSRKVKAMFIVPSDFTRSKDQAKHSIEGYSLIPDEPVINPEAPMPIVYLNAKVANELMAMSRQPVNQTIESLRSTINTTGQPQALTVNTSVNLKITRNEEKISSENVLGYVEGSDLKNELVVITAHYDHLGKHDGVVYNGADDDGSGTVAVMELAEAFIKAKQDGHGPRRSMLFMTVTGEEKGLLGSAWYTRHPVYPLANTMCDLNIDMIGRVDEDHSNDSNFVYVIGSDKISPDLKKSIETANKKYCHLKLDYRFDDEKDPNMFYYRSDHYNFAKNGIPVAFFFNGVHADYHKETDEISKINFSLMQKRTRLVFYTAWDMANRNKPLARKQVQKKTDK